MTRIELVRTSPGETCHSKIPTSSLAGYNIALITLTPGCSDQPVPWNEQLGMAEKLEKGMGGGNIYGKDIIWLATS